MNKKEIKNTIFRKNDAMKIMKLNIENELWGENPIKRTVNKEKEEMFGEDFLDFKNCIKVNK